MPIVVIVVIKVIVILVGRGGCRGSFLAVGGFIGGFVGGCVMGSCSVEGVVVVVVGVFIMGNVCGMGDGVVVVGGMGDGVVVVGCVKWGNSGVVGSVVIVKWSGVVVFLGGVGADVRVMVDHG